MEVVCKNTNSYLDISTGVTYTVVSERGDEYVIIDDDGTEFGYKKTMFDVVGEKLPELEEEYIYQGRIGICSASTVGDGKFNKHGISAVIIADVGQPLLSESGDWEAIQCEIIIRPIKRLGGAKMSGLRLDHVATSLGDDNYWGGEVKKFVEKEDKKK